VIAGSATDYTMIATTGFWLAPLLLSVPVFSRDTYSLTSPRARCCATASTRTRSARRKPE